MASKTVTNRNNVERNKKEIEKTVKKIKKVKPHLDMPEEEAEKIKAEIKKKQEEHEKELQYNAYKEKYKVDYLNPMEMRIFHACMMSEDKKVLAKEMGVSLNLIYYYTSKPSFQKAFTKEMEKQYEEQKRNRKALYTDIATKGLQLLLKRMDKALHADMTRQGDEKFDPESIISTKTIVSSIDKVVSLMQEEDGTKKLGLDISGGMNNTNINANSDGSDFNNEEFRKGFTELVLKTRNPKELITRASITNGIGEE